MATSRIRLNPRDLQLFEKLQQVNKFDPQQCQTPNIFWPMVLNLILKVLPVFMLLLKTPLSQGFGTFVLYEMLGIAIAAEFWVTKNFVSKRMLGCWWFFGNDVYGTEKFMFECRANDEYLDSVYSKLFWLMQICYTGFPVFLVFLTVMQIRILWITAEMLGIAAAIFLTGGINIFFNFQAVAASTARQKQIRKKLGPEFLKRLGLASITSYA